MTDEQEKIVKEIVRLEDALFETVQNLDNTENECHCDTCNSYKFDDGKYCLNCGGYVDNYD